MSEGWPHFSIAELACHHCKAIHMDPTFMTKLEYLRLDFGHALIVTSGYRCPEHDEAIRRARGQEGTGPHATGRAVDVAVWGEKLHRLLGMASRHGMTGIGIAGKGSIGDRFVHLDDLTIPEFPRPGVWTY